MALTSGTRLGPYEILAPLGAGGMGEVYRARDTRLDRSVAIKVLPADRSADPEFRARFEREARAVSQLGHPRICTLHDIGRQDGIDYLVMELLDGETLAARLERGPLPAAELVRYGIEIAEALEQAHKSGIVHRDLKPGNIMLTRNGVKLMDFGLARPAGTPGPVSDLTSSPTVTRPLTAEGTLVGTFQYMAPEQLEGREADARSDVWAFGAVLYEMATGKRPFEGRSQASLIAAILEREPPPIVTLAPLTPPALERLVRACLAKDPDDRIQSAHDARIALQWLAEPEPDMHPAARPRQSALQALGLAVLSAALAALAAVIATRLLGHTEPQVVRYNIAAEPQMATIAWPCISPDGRMLAFNAADSTGRRSLWVRPLSAFTAQQLPGTDNAKKPFWSPDSRYLAYFAGGELHKVPVSGGQPVLVCKAPGGADGTWGKRGVIVFDGTVSDRLRSVPAAGGEPSTLTTVDRAHGEVGHGWPFFLPDGRHYLYCVYDSAGVSSATLRLGELGSAQTRNVMKIQSRAEYSAGYLVFAKDRALVAQPFNIRSFEARGEPVTISEHVASTGIQDHFSVSPTGVLAYMPRLEGSPSVLQWVDRTGRALETIGPPASYRDLALSPDGKRLAYSQVDPNTGGEDIWIHDFTRRTTTRFTFDPKDDIWPVWSSSGDRIAFSSWREGIFSTYERATAGGTQEMLLHKARFGEGPCDWSRDGKWIAIQSLDAGNFDIEMLAATPGSLPAPFLSTAANETSPSFSPDGRWVAYVSNETGRPEVYVRPFSGTSKWQISSDGGAQPHWRNDGKELYYLRDNRVFMSVEIGQGVGLDPGVPVALFERPLEDAGFGKARYDVSADGKRFIVNTPHDVTSNASISVVLQWPAELGHR